MKIRLLLILCLTCLSSYANEVALTFDDAPRGAKGYFDGPTRAQKLIAALQSREVDKVAFFAVSSHLNKEGRVRLQAYNDAGFFIANHTHRHPNFNKKTLAEYRADFIRAHEALKGFSQFRPWFRFPFLREGDTVEKRDGMRKTLREYGYTNGYVTLNNYDWYMENLFQQAVKAQTPIDFEKLKAFYVGVLMEGIRHYNSKAIEVLGRSPKHVLLLHETDLNALFIGDLIDALRTEGWKIISPEEAYTDDISTYLSPKVAKYNPGRVGELVRDKLPKQALWHETLDETYLQSRFNREVMGQE